MSALRPTALLLLCAVSCGMGGSSGQEDCNVTLEVFPASPAVGDELTVMAIVSTFSGIPSYAWTVESPSTSIAVGSGMTIEFVADEPGAYRIDVDVVSAAGECSASQTVNVGAAGADVARYRLRYTPPYTVDLPAQDDPRVLDIPLGATTWSADRALSAGTLHEGTLTGPEGAPLAAYLRVSDGPEFVADEAGQYAVTLADDATSIALRIVPYDGAVAPIDLDVSSLDALAISDPGLPVTGTLLAADGVTPVPDARIAVSTAGLPASVATTGADGTFAVRVRGTEPPFVLGVVPPPGASWFPLRLVVPDLSSIGQSGAVLAIQLQDLPTATLGGAVASSGTRLTFVASIPDAATLSVDGGDPTGLAAEARITAVAAEDDTLPDLQLPFGTYQVVVAPPAGAAASKTLALDGLDLTKGLPLAQPEFSAASPVDTVVALRDADGAAVPGARVEAIAKGFLGIGVGTATAAEANDAGDATLALTRGMGYELVITPPRDADPPLARVRLDVSVPLDGEPVVDVALARAVQLSGTLRGPSGAGIAGIRIEAICLNCTTEATLARPVAETATGPGGAFLLPLPASIAP